jgi:hypothetical protein
MITLNGEVTDFGQNGAGVFAEARCLTPERWSIGRLFEGNGRFCER